LLAEIFVEKIARFKEGKRFLEKHHFAKGNNVFSCGLIYFIQQ
jgi:hypothetical protein